MCGFAGYLTNNTLKKCDVKSILNNMGSVIAHRGPDDSGIWHDSNYKSVGFVHRRLSILDLSIAGHQPMYSQSGRYVIVYNGEIYNHLGLRKCFKNNTIWKGESDTETLLACIELFGIKRTLEKITGMFSFALWDVNNKSLTLARDRMGEKPLYYGFQNRTLLFGSDLKSLKQHPDFIGEISRKSIALLMRFGYIPAPYSIYNGISKLPPGSFIQIEMHSKDPQPEYYWNFKNLIEGNSLAPHNQGYEKAVNNLDIVLGDSVEQQMISDVPLGAFLSGGIDSSSIVALAQSRSSSQVKTFSIGYDDKLYNEAEHAKLVAKHLGTNHTDLYITPKDAASVIPELPNIYTEPFADPSQIPMFLVSKMTRSHVTVALSGDGGDELFAGYNRHIFTNQYWGVISKLPFSVRKLISHSINSLSPNQWNKALLPLKYLVPGKYQQQNMGSKLYKVSKTLGSQSLGDMYTSLISRWENPEELVLGSEDTSTLHETSIDDFALSNDVSKIMAMDMVSFLPDDILCKVDRASMFAGLESRSPFLDHNVVEFAWGLPLDYKIKNRVGKSILRDVLYKYVPRELIDRPKMGFDIPIGSWLRGPLRDWASNLLDEKRLEEDGYFNVKLVRKIWFEHQSGLNNMEDKLWPVLMFQAWLVENK